MIHFQLFSASIGFATSAGSVFAYLDPGTGSFAIQILLATLFGGLFALKQSWSGVRAWIASTLRYGRARDYAETARPGIHGQSTADLR